MDEVAAEEGREQRCQDAVERSLVDHIQIPASARRSDSCTQEGVVVVTDGLIFRVVEVPIQIEHAVLCPDKAEAQQDIESCQSKAMRCRQSVWAQDCR